jgi:hypothetical protein
MTEQEQPKKLVFHPDPASKDKVKAILGEFAGHSSMCWENVRGAGVFDSVEAQRGVDAAAEALHQHFHLIPKGGNG